MLDLSFFKLCLMISIIVRYNLALQYYIHYQKVCSFRIFLFVWYDYPINLIFEVMFLRTTMFLCTISFRLSFNKIYCLSFLLILELRFYGCCYPCYFAYFSFYVFYYIKLPPPSQKIHHKKNIFFYFFKAKLFYD